jgi:hypothetical protein
MSTDTKPICTPTWTVAQLRALPPAQRDAILEAVASEAAALYSSDEELTAFEAFGPDDLYGESSSTTTG